MERHPWPMFPYAFLHDGLRAVLDAISDDSVLDMTLRAVLIYAFALAVVRSGKARMLSKATIFDVILVFILGSMLSRTINGSAPILASAIASIALVLVHYILGRLAYHSHAVGKVVKGSFEVLVRDGVPDDKALRRHHISIHDIEEAMRKKGLSRIEDVHHAHIERDGAISIVPRFRILEVEVQDGVQRVRIEV